MWRNNASDTVLTDIDTISQVRVLPLLLKVLHDPKYLVPWEF